MALHFHSWPRQPKLHLGSDPDILVPDLSGWRRETMPVMPDAPFFVLRPD